VVARRGWWWFTVVLLAWVVLSCITAWFLRRRADTAALVILGLWIAIPSVAAEVLTGIPFYSGSLANMHPAAWFTWIYIVVLAAVGRRWWPGVAAAPGELGLLGWVLVQLAVLTVVHLDGASPRGLIGNFAAGLVWFALSAVAAHANASWPRLLKNTVLFAASANVALSGLQVWLERVWPFDTFRRAYQSDFKEGADRTSGSLDHPLVLSLLLVVALPIAVTASRQLYAYAMTTLLFIGLLQSGSRAGLVLGILAIVPALIARRGNRVTNVLGLLGVAAVLSALLVSGAGQTVLERFQQDAGSTALRSEAYSFFADNWASYVFTGGGYASSFDLKDSGALQSSLENAYIMLAVDAGIVAALVFTMMLLSIAIRSVVHHGVTGRSCAALAGLTCAATFSSFMVQSAAMVIVLAPLALCLADSIERGAKGADHPPDKAWTDVGPAASGRAVDHQAGSSTTTRGASPSLRSGDRDAAVRPHRGEA
jgi:hypothetical protein